MLGTVKVMIERSFHGSGSIAGNVDNCCTNSFTLGEAARGDGAEEAAVEGPAPPAPAEEGGRAEAADDGGRLLASPEADEEGGRAAFGEKGGGEEEEEEAGATRADLQEPNGEASETQEAAPLPGLELEVEQEDVEAGEAEEEAEAEAE